MCELFYGIYLLLIPTTPILLRSTPHISQSTPNSTQPPSTLHYPSWTPWLSFRLLPHPLSLVPTAFGELKGGRRERNEREGERGQKQEGGKQEGRERGRETEEVLKRRKRTQTLREIKKRETNGKGKNIDKRQRKSRRWK